MKLPSRVIITRKRSPWIKIMIDSFFPRILALQNEPQGRHDGEIGNEIAEGESVAQVVPGGRLSPVQLCAKDCA